MLCRIVNYILILTFRARADASADILLIDRKYVGLGMLSRNFFIT